MARNQTFGAILQMYRKEARISRNEAHNQHVSDQQRDLINGIVQQLWEDYDWPHLRIRRNYPLQATERFYDFTADFDLSRIEKIELCDNGEWVKLRARITAEDYSLHESDLDEQSWPARAWAIYEGERIEIWPIPDQNGDPATLEGHLRVHGVRSLPVLVEPEDVCPLDDRVIAKLAASDHFFAKGDEKMGSIRLNEGRQRLASLVGNLKKVKQVQMFGIGEPMPMPIDRFAFAPPYKA